MKPKMIAIGALAVFAATIASGRDAHAQWCAHYDPYISNCGFSTFQQCLATISGVGGVCARDYRVRAEQPPPRPWRKIKKRRR